MHSSGFCLTFLLFIIHHTKSKVYVIDLAGEGTGGSDDQYGDDIKLTDMLKIINNPAEENRFQEVLLEETEDVDDGRFKSKTSNLENCLALVRTVYQMQICLENLYRIEKRSVGIRYKHPEYHHEYYSQSPHRSMYTLYDSFSGGLKQPFRDLTRQEFSQDYLDISDLSRSENYENDYIQNENYKRTLQSLGFPIGRRTNDNKRRIFNNANLRSYSSDETSGSSNSDESKESKPKKKENKHKKTNRFQVVNGDSSQESDEETQTKRPKKTESSVESEENYGKKKPKSKVETEESEEYYGKKTKSKVDSDESEEYVKKKPKKQREIEVNSDSSNSSPEVTEKPKKSKEKYVYLQGNKQYDNFRRRLQNFLPKRTHWTEDQMHHLGYYWF